MVCQTNPSRAADFAIATGSGNLKATLLGLHCLMDCRPVTLLETLIKEGAAVITFAGLSRLSFFSRAKAPTSTHTRAIRPSISTRNIPGYDRRFAVKAAGRWRSGPFALIGVRRSFTRKRKSCAVSASRARLQREQLRTYLSAVCQTT